MTQSQWIFIEPNDVWLFRDNKPFSAQQNFVARGQFPPNPQVMQGVVRTHAYYQDPQHPVVTDKVGMDELQLEGPYLAERLGDGTYTRYFPAPLDMLYDKDNGIFSILAISRLDADIISDFPVGWRPLIRNPKDGKYLTSLKEAEGWLTEAQFRQYLEAKLETGKLTQDKDIFHAEERVGLGLDYSRKANQQGMFYHAQFTRLKPNFGLMFQSHYQNALFEAQGMIRIGGESRFGRYEQARQAPSSLITHKNGNLRVVLLTPTYFDGGWQPADGDWSAWLGKDAKLVSAAIGKPYAISGWDIAKREPKPLRHFVPACSVYYFSDAEWQGKPFSHNITDMPFAQMGFGTVATGLWK